MMDLARRKAVSRARCHGFGKGAKKGPDDRLADDTPSSAALVKLGYLPPRRPSFLYL